MEDERIYKEQPYLFTIIKVARDEDLAEQIGRDRYFDLVDHDKVRSFRFQKKKPFKLFKEVFAKEFGIPVQFQRFWIWANRPNRTYRPNRPLTPQEEALFVEQLMTNNPELKLFLEVEIGLDLHPIPPPVKTNEDILVFFKLYDPVKGELRYVGRLFVKSSSMPIEILRKINQMSGFSPDEEIELYEEIRFEPSIMCPLVDKRTSFRSSRIIDGDIICFQKSPPTKSEEECRYPNVPSFLEFVHNVVHPDGTIDRLKKEKLEKEKLEEEKKKKEDKLKKEAEEEKKRKEEEERKQKEAEEQKQKEEEKKRKEEEEERKQKEAEKHKQKEEEQKRKEEEERKQKEAEEHKQKEEEQKRKDEEERKQKEVEDQKQKEVKKKRKEEEERKQKEAEEHKQKEEEKKRKEEEERKQKEVEEQKQKEEEKKRKEEEEERKQKEAEEHKQKEEEQKRKEEEERKQKEVEEQKQKEEEKKRKEEEERKQKEAEEHKQKEEEKKRKEEEERKQKEAEEQKQKEEEKKRNEEEEERKQKEVKEQKQKEEEKKRMEEEEERKEKEAEEHKQKEQEKKRKEEEERKQKEAEEQKQKEEKKKRKEVQKQNIVVPPQIPISDSIDKNIEEAEEIERELSGMVAIFSTSGLASSGRSRPSVEDLPFCLGTLKEFLEIKDPKEVLADPSLYSSFKTISTILLQKPKFLGQTKLSALRCFCYDLNLIQKAYTKSLELGKKVEAKETEKKIALDEANGFITRLNSTKSSLKNMRDRKQKLLRELNQLEHSMAEARIQLKQILEEKDQVHRTSSNIKDIEASLQEAKQELEQELELIDDRWITLKSAFMN